MSHLQSETQIHKDEYTDTLYIGMNSGEDIITCGIFYFEVLKGSVKVMSMF